MRILFYIEPWIQKGHPEWKNSWVPLFFDIVRTLNNFNAKKFEFAFVIGDAQIYYVDDILSFSNTTVSIIEQRELKKVFKYYNDALLAWYNGTYTEDELNMMSELVHKKLDGFVPDVIWSFVTPVPFISKLFKKSLVLHQELGMLGRNPYPISWYLDPLGTFGNSFIARFSDELKKCNINENQQKLLDAVRDKYTTLIRQNQPFTREQLDPGANFKALVLVPLQYSGIFYVDGVSKYKTQYDFLLDCLEKIDDDIGIVVTEHVNPLAETILHPAAIEYLRNTYSNFIYLNEFQYYPMSSQYLLDLVDGVVSISSTVGQQALFWGKALFTESQSQLKPFTHGTKIDEISNFFDNNKDIESRDNMIFYLLTHYYIPEEKYFSNGKWLSAFLSKACDKYSKDGEINFDFFDPIDTDVKIMDYYINNSKNYNKVYPEYSYLLKEGQKEVNKNKSPNNQETASDLSQHELSLKNHRARIRTLMHQIDALETEKRRFFGSLSWRLTYPLRKVKEFLKAKW